jgi:hypothetical protein
VLTFLIGVYLGCYGLHCALVSCMTWLIGDNNRQAQDEQESKHPLLIRAVL